MMGIARWLDGAVVALVLAAPLSLGSKTAGVESRSASPRSAAELMDVLMWNREPVGGPFSLIDHAGKPRTDADFRGRLLLVYFGYTACPDVCPTDLQEIARALTLLDGQADQVQPLFVTLDPANDTPSLLAAYLDSFHPRLIGLTGSEAMVHQAADAYRVFYRKGGPGNDAGAMEHSAFIYLMDRNGRYLGFFPPGTSAERMLTIVRPHLHADSAAATER